MKQERETSPWVELTKPGITFFSAIVAGGAYALAPGPVILGQLLLLLFGTMTIVAGANVLNMYLERHSDKLMGRTQTRPLPAGRLEPEGVLAFGVFLSALATTFLTFAVNPLTGFLGAIALVIYVLVYTPMKRSTTLATLIGAVPGAMPALMGWTAHTNSINGAGLAVFGVLLLWQVPHFHAIAMYRREDYRRAGLKVLPVERGDDMTRYAILLYLAAQVQLSLLMFPLGVSGPYYTVAAMALGVGYMVVAMKGIRKGGRRWARVMFLTSVAYLPLLFFAMVLDGTA